MLVAIFFCTREVLRDLYFYCTVQTLVFSTCGGSMKYQVLAIVIAGAALCALAFLSTFAFFLGIVLMRPEEKLVVEDIARGVNMVMLIGVAVLYFAHVRYAKQYNVFSSRSVTFTVLTPLAVCAAIALFGSPTNDAFVFVMFVSLVLFFYQCLVLRARSAQWSRL